MINKNINTPLIQLGNSSKNQIKKDAAKLVVQARKDSKNWNKMFSQQQN